MRCLLKLDSVGGSGALAVARFLCAYERELGTPKTEEKASLCVRTDLIAAVLEAQARKFVAACWRFLSGSTTRILEVTHATRILEALRTSRILEAPRITHNAKHCALL